MQSPRVPFSTLNIRNVPKTSFGKCRHVKRVRRNKHLKKGLTIGGELVPLEDGDAQNILVQVLNEELTVEVPLGVDCVIYCAGGETLCSHGNLAIWITLSWRVKATKKTIKPKHQAMREVQGIRGLAVGSSRS